MCFLRSRWPTIGNWLARPNLSSFIFSWKLKGNRNPETPWTEILSWYAISIEPFFPLRFIVWICTWCVPLVDFRLPNWSSAVLFLRLKCLTRLSLWLYSPILIVVKCACLESCYCHKWKFLSFEGKIQTRHMSEIGLPFELVLKCRDIQWLKL